MQAGNPVTSGAPATPETAGATRYWDAYTLVGPRTFKHPAEQWSRDCLLAEMEHCQVAGAMVLSTQSIHYDPHRGNLDLTRELANAPRLYPVWNVMPAESGEFPEPPELLRHLRGENVSCTAIHPKTNGWDILDPCGDSLFGMLSEQAFPVTLPRVEVPDYATLRKFLGRWPDLPLILTEANWTEQRFLIPLLKRHRNLHITFDKFQAHYGIEDLCSMGLEAQLLYGSKAPVMSMGAHRCYIDYAEISDSARGKIAAGNLGRLLNAALPPEAPAPSHDDPLMRAARRGLPLPEPVIDMHMHILDEGLHGGGGSFRMSRGGPRGVFHLLKRLGCTGGGFMSWNGTVGGDSASGNRCVQRVLDGAPCGFWGLGTFDPTHYTAAELKTAIPRLYADSRFLGMKPYRVYGLPYDSPLYEFWWKFGNEKGLYALIHRTRPDFSEVVKLAERYPRVQWIVAHCAASYPVADLTIAAVQKHPNIHAEITYTPVQLGIIDYLIEGCGADRVLYGSDLPMRDPRQQLGWVVYSRLSLEKKIRVLGGNAMALIGNVLHGTAHAAGQDCPDKVVQRV